MRELIENARDLAGLDTTVRAALRISSTFRSQIEKKCVNLMEPNFFGERFKIHTVPFVPYHLNVMSQLFSMASLCTCF
jgi:hypothetical protein